MTNGGGRAPIYKKPSSTISTVHLLPNQEASASVCRLSIGTAVVRSRWSYAELYPLNMSKHHSELTQREQELLKCRRDSDTKAAELVKMEKMLEQTKSLMDKKREPALDCTGYQENMGKHHEERTIVAPDGR